jgi:hypothetical protein
MILALSPFVPLLAAFVFLASPGNLAAQEAAREAVGVVDKVENEAKIVSGGRSIVALIGTEVRLQDELRTGTDGRLKVTFRDGTVLTLGENASIVMDRYVFDPDQGLGEVALETTQGAFRFVTGRIGGLKQKTIGVVTPVAQIGVRGTEFWGGPLDERYGVLLLEGEITVSNQAGNATLSVPGQGTNIPSSGAVPGAPSTWTPEKIARAVATVTLH